MAFCFHIYGSLQVLSCDPSDNIGLNPEKSVTSGSSSHSLVPDRLESFSLFNQKKT